LVKIFGKVRTKMIRFDLLPHIVRLKMEAIQILTHGVERLFALQYVGARI